MRHNALRAGICLATVLVLAAVGVGKTIQSPPKIFEGDGLTLSVRGFDGRTWTGTITLSGHAAGYPFTGRNDAAEESGIRVAGTFTVDGDAFPFSITKGGDRNDLTLTSGGATYRLNPKISGGAILGLPGGGVAKTDSLPAELKLKTVEFRDADMGNVVACTMLVPDGWKSEGQVKWSQGDVIYPQKIIEVKSADDLKIQFVPTMNFFYSETDPAYVAQMRQLGIPNPPKERDGISPPTEEGFGEWFASFVAANNKAAHNVKVVRQERDKPLEQALAKMLGQQATNADMKIFVIAVEYDDDESGGKRMHDELSLNLSVNPTLDLNPTRFTTWSMYINGVVTAPAERFDSAKPLLCAIAGTLREDVRWWSAKEQTLVEIMRLRHEGNMKNIAAVGEAIRKAGQTYGQISDDSLASWKRRNASSDEVQRQSVNAINSTEDYKLPAGDPNGASVKLPGLYENVYKPTTGDYYLLTNKTLESSDLTKLEPVKRGE